MTTIDYLEKQYNHSFDMVKLGETKNTTLIAFNGAIIVGMVKLASDISSFNLNCFLIYIVVMCSISIFIALSSLVAKIKHTTNHKDTIERNDNLLFFGTLADMTPEQVITQIVESYGCDRANENHENDLARQVIITSQIAARKFNLFNIGIGFTICALLTPISLLFYFQFLDHDK